MIGGAGQTASLIVFDDGILVVSGSKAASAGVAFGAIGGAVGAVAAKKALAKKLAIIDELGPSASSGQAAAAVKGAQHLSATDITAARIAKGLGQGRKLRFDLPSGPVKLRWAGKQTPVATVAGLLQLLLGDRLEVDEGAT